MGSHSGDYGDPIFWANTEYFGRNSYLHSVTAHKRTLKWISLFSYGNPTAALTNLPTHHAGPEDMSDIYSITQLP
jgi:hypothetical protein